MLARSLLLLHAATLVCLSSTAASQATGLSIYANTPNENVGSGVCDLGDVNGDGHDDFVVGASGYLSSRGAVRVHSGADGSILYEAVGVDPGDPLDFDEGDHLGWSVANAGDVNGDGVPDYVAGAPGTNTNGRDSGSVFVFSGADGSVLHTFIGDASYDWFGGAVGGAGDVNGDGFADVIVGASKSDINGSGAGLARVFSGLDGTTVFEFYGDGAVHRLGLAVDGAGDVNGDGFADVIAGARPFVAGSGSSSGYVRVISGADATEIYRVSIDDGDDCFGCSVAGVGDLDMDGHDDFVVGAPFAAGSAGLAVAFSGIDGHPIYTFQPHPNSGKLGSSVGAAGDVDADGIPDIVLGAIGEQFYGESAGGGYVYSGATGKHLFTSIGDHGGSQYGFAVSGAGDVNNDGVADLVIGGPFTATGGLARVILGQTPFALSYCEAAPNSTGRPAEIHVEGNNSVSGNNLLLVAERVPALQNGLFIYALVPDSTPLGNGTLCLSASAQGFINRLPFEFSTSGHVLTHHLDLASPPAPESLITPGSVWYFQAWFRDVPAGGAGFNFSDGVAVLFGP